jgi:ethylbenzene dioxygenase beta subunit
VLSPEHQFSDLTTADAAEVSAFLFAESRILSEHRYRDWLQLLHPDIHYWMPGIENLRHEDAHAEGAYRGDHMAFFDDSLLDLERRVDRFYQPQAWAENPPTRNLHSVSSVEVFADAPSGFIAYSAVHNVRNRGVSEEPAVLFARRRDHIVRVDGSLRLRKRLIVIPNSTLPTKNLNTFL